MAVTLLKSAPPQKTPKIYDKYYICPEAEKCKNLSCYMRAPRRKVEYFRTLKDICTLTNCIENFNKSFSCNGKKMKLQEFTFFRRGHYINTRKRGDV